MLSVCIPIYNRKIEQLIFSLTAQIPHIKEPIEIICIDDCSENEYRLANAKVCNSIVRYIELTENIGRAQVRNLFLEYTQYDYLLFLDCNVSVVNNSFLVTYIEEIIGHMPDIICGGHEYPRVKSKRAYRLRQLYGRSAECRPASERNVNPCESFISSNFIIRKSIFSKIRFDERINGYGHEDTLFGFRLFQQNANVLHIENRVLKPGSEPNSVFISKTENAVTNLVRILELTNSDATFIEHVLLLRFYFRHEFFPHWAFKPFMPFMKKLLVWGVCNSVTLLSLYKLSLLAAELKDVKKH